MFQLVIVIVIRAVVVGVVGVVVSVVVVVVVVVIHFRRFEFDFGLRDETIGKYDRFKGLRLMTNETNRIAGVTKI